MKRLILGPLAALALCSTTADAATIQERLCAQLAALTEAVAIAHQREIPLIKSLNILDRELASDPDSRAFYQKLYVSIYNTPRFATEENQQRAINELRDQAHVKCLMEVQAAPRSPIPEDPT